MDREITFEHRKVTFMDTGLAKSANEFSTQRSQAVVTLRKQKRQESIRYKRLKQTTSPSCNLSLDKVLNELDISKVSTVKNLRKLLSYQKFDFNKLVQMCPNIIEILTPGLNNPQSELAFEVSWCLTNLALGPSYLIMEISKLIPAISAFIINPVNKMLAEQACWVLGNLAADSFDLRNGIRQVCGLVKGISALLQFKIPSLSAITCWTLCNLIRGSNPDISLFVENGVIFPVLDLTQRDPNSDQCIEALWFLSLLTNNTSPEAFQQIFKEENISRFFLILSSANDPKLIIPILRIFGNAFLYYPYIDYLFNRNFIELLIQFLSTESSQIQRETAWLISNIVSCPREYIDILMSSNLSNEILDLLIWLLDNDAGDIKAEAGIALYNICEVQSSKYLLRILRKKGERLISFYQEVINNVPMWLKLGIQAIYDVDLLKASLGFCQICFEFSIQNQLDIPEETYSALNSSDLREALENCYFVFKDLRGQNEQFMKVFCSDLLKRYCEGNQGFTFT
ncbi:unnamed protein product [Blepharisma stoltei]|uniref:Importin subunit alpha n=1 Tax=Blepharisma stoltei TaxID=1481888 RepID=A0AAU9JNW0_9CILI|nr:unnamed protein product [Blepharisma stoltei]